MTKLCNCLALLMAASAARAQTEAKVSAATLRYEEYRTEITHPSFASGKVDSLVKSLHGDAVSSSVWKQMGVEEKFTYTMVQPEWASQVCDIMPVVAGEEKMIFGHVPDAFAGGNLLWSDREESFLKSHRTQAIGLIRRTMQARHRVGVNLKNAILLLNAYELIPDMLAIYQRDRKDQDILTACLCLMHDAKYGPFLMTPTYKKLYGKNANFQAYIVADRANQDLTIQRAMAFYHSKV